MWKKVIHEIKGKYKGPNYDWSRDKFATIRNGEFENLLEQYKLNSSFLNLMEIDSNTMNIDEFRIKFEKTSIPCIIKNIPLKENWKAQQSWNFSNFKKRYRECYFCCGRDDEGEDLLIKLDYFLSYMQENTDDSPLYLFDTYFELDDTSAELLQDYQTPKYFPEDYLSLIDPERRPLYRWLLIGPKRSGTVIHIDPLATSAWNTLLSGKKLWILIPPDYSKLDVKGLYPYPPQDTNRPHNPLSSIEPINYFVERIPDILKSNPHFTIYQALQEEGDTIFVPSGWWHAVLNLEDTIAITQV